MELILPEDGLLAGQPELISQVAVDLLNKYVPSDWEDATFQEIVNGDYGGSGTTCGFLAHWLIWRLGCRTKSLVNRTDHESGLRYSIGANISRLRWNPMFQVYDESLPTPGDIVLVSAGPPTSEHVFCFLEVDEESRWVSADAGQRHPTTGKQCARMRQRVFNEGALIDGSGSRRIQGWLPLSSLELSMPVTL